MAKQIIILDNVGGNNYNVAFWLSVPSTRQSFYANASATSAFKQASALELSAIQSGAVVEQVSQFGYPAGTPLATIMGLLQTEWTNRQAVITSANPWLRYGSFWDGTTWTSAGVA